MKDVARTAVPGSAGIFARDAFSTCNKRAHGVSRAEMPALPGTEWPSRYPRPNVAQAAKPALPAARRRVVVFFSNRAEVRPVSRRGSLRYVRAAQHQL
jgi:hypothetical protein